MPTGWMQLRLVMPFRDSRRKKAEVPAVCVKAGQRPPRSDIIYAENWIVPRWGNLPLEQVKTVEVERWLRATRVADGTKAKIKCVMSALFSHAVRWEFCGHNPISSGIPVGTGGKRGPSTGVRISAKRQRCPLVLSSEQVKLGLAELEFRDQLLVFLEGAFAEVV